MGRLKLTRLSCGSLGARHGVANADLLGNDGRIRRIVVLQQTTSGQAHVPIMQPSTLLLWMLLVEYLHDLSADARGYNPRLTVPQTASDD